MNTGPNWTADTNGGAIGVAQLQNFGPMLREGLDKHEKWGYGIRRITVKDKDNLCPMTFSAMSYKDQSGNWSIGLRMNVDQVSPIKFQPWKDGDNIVTILTNLMSAHLYDKGYTGDYGRIV